jgi:hypothetical protein
MSEPRMHVVNTNPQVLELPRRRPRPRARSVRRREAAKAPGRAWINGREVGGGDPRFDHLAVSYD